MSDGIPTWRVDAELPGVPLRWLQNDRRTPVPLSSMGAILKAQIVTGMTDLVVEQTTLMVASDSSPNWTMTRFDPATLTAVRADIIARGCTQHLYAFVPMYRDPSSTSDEVWDPEANNGMGGFMVRFTLEPT